MNPKIKAIVNGAIVREVARARDELIASGSLEILGIEISKEELQEIKILLKWELEKIIADYIREVHDLKYSLSQEGKLWYVGTSAVSFEIWIDILDKCCKNNSEDNQNKVVDFLQTNNDLLLVQQAYAELPNSEIVIDYCKKLLSEEQQLKARIRFRRGEQ